MGAFDRSFLVGVQRITIEDPGPFSQFQGGRVGEFRTVVSQDGRKQAFERLLAEACFQLVKDFGYGNSCVVITQEDEQELGLRPEEGEEDFVAIQAGQNAVHLRGDGVGMLGEEGIVIGKGTVLAAGPVDLELALAARQFSPDFPGQIEVFGGEKAGVEQGV